MDVGWAKEKSEEVSELVSEYQSLRYTLKKKRILNNFIKYQTTDFTK